MLYAYKFTYKARLPLTQVTRSGSDRAFVNREGIVLARDDLEAERKLAEWLEARGYAPDNYRKLERFCEATVPSLRAHNLWPIPRSRDGAVFTQGINRGRLSAQQMIEVIQFENERTAKLLLEVNKMVEAKKYADSHDIPFRCHDHLDESLAVSIDRAFSDSPPPTTDPNACMDGVFPF